MFLLLVLLVLRLLVTGTNVFLPEVEALEEPDERFFAEPLLLPEVVFLPLDVLVLFEFLRRFSATILNAPFNICSKFFQFILNFIIPPVEVMKLGNFCCSPCTKSGNHK